MELKLPMLFLRSEVFGCFICFKTHTDSHMLFLLPFGWTQWVAVVFNENECEILDKPPSSVFLSFISFFLSFIFGIGVVSQKVSSHHVFVWFVPCKLSQFR